MMGLVTKQKGKEATNVLFNVSWILYISVEFYVIRLMEHIVGLLAFVVASSVGCQVRGEG